MISKHVYIQSFLGLGQLLVPTSGIICYDHLPGYIHQRSLSANFRRRSICHICQAKTFNVKERETCIKNVGDQNVHTSFSTSICTSITSVTKMTSYYNVHSPLVLISEMLPKSSLKLISSTCSSIWLSTYLLCLVDVFFNRQSAYLWVQTVLLFSRTCSFIRMSQTSYRCFLRKTKRC